MKKSKTLIKYALFQNTHDNVTLTALFYIFNIVHLSKKNKKLKK